MGIYDSTIQEGAQSAPYKASIAAGGKPKVIEWPLSHKFALVVPFVPDTSKLVACCLFFNVQVLHFYYSRIERPTVFETKKGKKHDL